MEELPEFTTRAVSFRNRHNVSTIEQTCFGRALKHPEMEKKQLSSSNHQSMEFLCRPWSSTGYDFQHILHPRKLLLPAEHKEEENEDHNGSENKAINGIYLNQKHDKKRMDFSHLKGLLKGKGLTSFMRSQREKKKDEGRLHTANLHAALSLTQLAAAISSISGCNCKESTDVVTTMTRGSLGSTGENTGHVVASAAALLTSVCAGAAESLGAKRTRIASAIESGLATQTPTGMITLTAIAATSLRGAAMLQSRTKADTSYLVQKQELLKTGARMSIIMPSGKKEVKWVTIDTKQRQVTLSCTQKYFRGALTTTKEYKIIKRAEEIKDCRNSNFLSLETDKGILRLLFEDDKQSTLWISTISNKIIKRAEEIKDCRNSNFLSLETDKGFLRLLFEDDKQSTLWISTISTLLQMHNLC